MSSEAWDPWRELTVPEFAAGMRLDRFLAGRFLDRSRSFFAQCIRRGEVQDEAGHALAASHRVAGGQVLRLLIDGIAPSTPPPPFPRVLWEGEGVVAIDKPPGLLCHPAGTEFQWGLISLAKRRWPHDRVDLVHRIDRDTSGVLLLTRSIEANRLLKAAVKAGRVRKEYDAIVRGEVSWEERTIDAPIGAAEGPIRIQMAVRENGLPARTSVRVVRRRAGMTHVRCRLHTGRTHQIRVHLDHVGHALVGDRLYGVPPDVFLELYHHGMGIEEITRLTGAPRHALHAALVAFNALSGATVTVESALAADLEALWSSEP